MHQKRWNCVSFKSLFPPRKSWTVEWRTQWFYQSNCGVNTLDGTVWNQYASNLEFLRTVSWWRKNPASILRWILQLLQRLSWTPWSAKFPKRRLDFDSFRSLFLMAGLFLLVRRILYMVIVYCIYTTFFSLRRKTFGNRWPTVELHRNIGVDWDKNSESHYRCTSLYKVYMLY